MATRLLCPRDRTLVVYVRNLQSLCAGVKTFSSQGRKSSKGTAPPPDINEVATEPLSTWLDIRAGIFGPSDQRLPLPGNVGPGQQLDPMLVLPTIPLTATPQSAATTDLLNHSTNHEHQLQALNQCSSTIVGSNLEEMSPSAADLLECRAQQCPDLVKKDFLDLFPGRSLKEGPLSVVTLSQKTLHDMGAWSHEMEMEREELLEYFIIAAEDICNTLEKEGYWANFIDPTSGRPYYGQFTNATLFETDERYRYLGFCIEDLGCCKIISHRLWGTHVFVGAIFTNAPVESEVLEQALKKHQRS